MVREQPAGAINETSQSLYSRLGGEAVLRQFVEQLYAFMDEADDVAPVRKMHSQDLSYAADRLFMFLSGMLGGPPLYMAAFGHPRLRRKHLPFAIGDDERDQWLLCAQHAADQLPVEDSVREELMLALTKMADHLRNQGPAVQACGQLASQS